MSSKTCKEIPIDVPSNGYKKILESKVPEIYPGPAEENLPP